MFSVAAARANIHDPPPLAAHLNIHVFSLLSPKNVPHAGGSHFRANFSLIKKSGFQRTQTALLGSGEGEHRGVGNRQYQRRRSRTEVGGARQPHHPHSHPHYPPHTPNTKRRPIQTVFKIRSAARHAAPPPMCYPRDAAVTAARRSVAS